MALYQRHVAGLLICLVGCQITLSTTTTKTSTTMQTSSSLQSSAASKKISSTTTPSLPNISSSKITLTATPTLTRSTTSMIAATETSPLLSSTSSKKISATTTSSLPNISTSKKTLTATPTLTSITASKITTTTTTPLISSTSTGRITVTSMSPLLNITSSKITSIATPTLASSKPDKITTMATTPLPSSTTSMKAATATPLLLSSATNKKITATTTSSLPNISSSKIISTATPTLTSSKTNQITTMETTPLPSSTTSMITATETLLLPSSITSNIITTATTPLQSSTSSKINTAAATPLQSYTLSEIATTTTTPLQSSTLSKITTLATTPLPTDTTVTNTADARYVHVPKSVDLPIKFYVKVDKPFTESLKNKSSDVYISLEKKFRLELSKAYGNVSTFRYINIISFRNGSVVCDYEAVFTSESLKILLPENMSSIETAIKELYIDDMPMIPSNMTTIFETVIHELRTDGCKVILNPCSSGYFCNASSEDIRCISYCWSPQNKVCQNGGQCYHDTVTNTTNCRCTEDNEYVYSGRYCKTKTEKLALPSTNIIAISAGAGGGIILILVISLAVLIVKRRKSNENQPSDDKQSSYGMSEMNIERWNNPALSKSKSRGSTMNEYQSGLPGDTKYVVGREHRVFKDSQGAETYMYQPSMQVSSFVPPIPWSSSNIETRSTRAASTYDYIDTEMKYQIKRPSVKVNYLNRI